MELRRRLSILLLLALALPVSRSAAQTSETGWYTVRPGETLEGLAERFFGSSDQWKRLAQINPEIRDPDRIEPGQRIRVPVPDRTDMAAARVRSVSNQVETQPTPIAWKDANVGDLLIERDGVRTHRSSSTEMAFNDGTRLIVTESSLVYLQNTGGALRGVRVPRAIEIVEGQADVESRPAAAAPAGAPPREVQIVLGGTRATARPAAAGGGSQARARRADGGGAKLMVYGGDSDVEAGGAKVHVAQGMGTSVEAQGPPGPPEKLLPAPAPLLPASGAVVACPLATFTWDPVPDAASYVVEICRDAGCSQLVERTADAAASQWKAPALPAGSFFWRVTARSRSGLDGYPSPALPFTFAAEGVDRDAPTGAVTLAGPHMQVGDRVFVAGAVPLEVKATDAGSGVDRWLPLVDGREVDPSVWSAPWTAGAHTAGAIAIDRCGNRSPVTPVSFVVDTEPPVLRWDRRSLADYEKQRKEQQRGSWLRFGGGGGLSGLSLAWSTEQQWLPLHWGEKGTSGQGPVYDEIVLASDEPHVFLHAAGLSLAPSENEATLAQDQVLHIAAEDGGSGVDHLTLRTLKADDGGTVLEAEAVDAVGNKRTERWRLRR